MTKRSAITMAAGVATALLIGIAAIALMMGEVSVATPGGERKPIVKRQVQTVTVHRKSHADASPSVHVVDLGSAAGSSSISAFDDEGSEHDGDSSFDDDGGSSQSLDDSSQGTVGDD